MPGEKLVGGAPLRAGRRAPVHRVETVNLARRHEELAFRSQPIERDLQTPRLRQQRIARADGEEKRRERTRGGEAVLEDEQRARELRRLRCAKDLPTEVGGG